MLFSLRQIEVFRLLMQTRNVTEAARLLRISQPAASQLLKELEQRLGLNLFVRSRNRIYPTSDARSLVSEVEQMFTRINRVESRAAELRDLTSGSLSIATIATLTGFIVPKALSAFRAQRPGVQLTVSSQTAREVAKSVQREEADLGIVYAPVEDHNVAVEPIMKTRMVCLLPPNHPLAGTGVIAPKMLADQTLILLDPSTSPGMLLHERLPGKRLRKATTIEVNLSFTALSMVRHGLGLVVTDPLILLSGLADGLVVRPFEPGIDLTLCFAYARQRPMPRTALKFLVDLRAAIKAATQQLEARGITATALA